MKFQFFSKEVSQFFCKAVKANIESREKNGIVRNDMINLLLEVRKQENTQNKREISDLDITSQALIFFFGGFDSVSALMYWMAYELGANRDIQARLIQEVDETNEICKGQVTYEAILGMKYLDMVVSESLRKWPNGIALDRVCTKPYTIHPQKRYEKPINLKVGDLIWIPVFAIHRDPKYYPEPDRFDPERFNDENKKNITPYSYFPFGVGPRNCIASRFALLETKLLFFYLLVNFEIVPIARTQIPASISKKTFSLLAEDGFWFGLKTRTK